MKQILTSELPVTNKISEDEKTKENIEVYIFQILKITERLLTGTNEGFCSCSYTKTS